MRDFQGVLAGAMESQTSLRRMNHGVNGAL
jgi:hypothetical protein